MLKKIFLILFIVVPFSVISQAADNNKISDIRKINFFSPFNDSHRNRFSTITKRTKGKYGDYRNSYIKGHRHSGIDLVGKPAESVYAIGKGEVVRIYWNFPNQTVLLRHRLADDKIIYSAYTHLRDIRVKEGDQVDEKTILGRIFNKKEMEKASFSSCHLHLEIRKSIADDGKASYSAMSTQQLDEYLTDPLVFFKSQLH
ncbi:MAG: M23 family metallopeptidase [Syntrophales bacterium]|jgi:murein DD-endopeptidase MepM/ murein hydrolase activator NlpD